MRRNIFYSCLFTIVTVFSTDAQSIDEKAFFLEFLIKEKEAESLKDSIYLHYSELLGKKNDDGIYVFGLTSSHAKRFISIKENSSFKIIESLKLETILNEVTFFFERNDVISFKDKIGYYKKIIEIIEYNAGEPWVIPDR